MSSSVTARQPFFTRLRLAIWRRRIYLPVFMIPVAVMYAAYALFNVHPFGTNSVLVLDLNGQYVYYYEALRDAFWGDGSLMYDWSRNLSGEMFGVFAYYLASPFMLVICLLPRTWMCGAIELMQLLKIGAAAVTFAWFIRRRSKATNTAMIVFGSSYALMSYMVVQTMDPMWLDGLVLLPLICSGVHRLVEEGKMAPYIVPLALMFFAHFYIGYMVGFFTFLYFIYVCLSQEGRKLPRHFVLRIIQFGAATLTAIMCAAIVLIPVYNSLKLGKLEFTTPDWSMATQFDLLTFVTKLFPMTYDTVYPQGLPMIYCGTAALLLVPLFFMNRLIPMKEKALKGLLAVTLVVCMYLRPVDIVWHGFQVPNWLPYRYSFCFSFVLLLMAYRAWEKSDGFTAKELGGAMFGLFVFLMWCEREGIEHFTNFENRTNKDQTHAVMQGIWFSMIAVAVFFALIYLWKRYRGKRLISIAVCIVVPLELLVNAMDTLHKINVDVAYSKYTSYEPYMSDLRNAVDHINYFDSDPFYRMEATFHRTVNDPIGTGYYGVSHSSSTMNAPALLMLHRLGYAYGGHYTKYEGATYITDALFDIRYLIDKDDYNDVNRYKNVRDWLPEDYELITHTDQKDARYKFYRNPYALGLGIVAPSDVKTVALEEYDPFENQNRVFNALLPQEERTAFFTRLTAMRVDDENVAEAMLVDGHKKFYVKDEAIAESHLDFLLHMDKDSELYMYLPTKYERNCNIWYQTEEEYRHGNEPMQFAGQFFVGDNYSIINLGSFDKDEEIRVRVTIDNDENAAYWVDELFYTFDMDAFRHADEVLRQRTFNITSFDDTKLEGTCTAEAGQYLFTTIPYENGWTITLNGSTIKPQKALDSMIVIPLEPGENRIKMVFSPNYYRLAVIVTICGLVVLALVILIEFREGMIFKKLVKKAEMDGSSQDDDDDDEDELSQESLANVIKQMTASQTDDEAEDEADDNAPAAEETAEEDEQASDGEDTQESPEAPPEPKDRRSRRKRKR